jgi:hypothetical protein
VTLGVQDFVPRTHQTMSLTEYRELVQQQNNTFRKGQTREELNARVHGTWFASLESVCDLDRVSIAASKFPNIQRDKADGEFIYPNTANTDYLETCAEATTEESDATNTLQIITAVDFLFNLEGEKAHLISNAPVCHVAYTKIVQAASGYVVDSYEKRRKLLNGMKGRSRRFDNSGIKHSKYNKFHRFLRKQLLDSTPPALFIVPVLTLSEVKNWKCSSFDAMVLPCGNRGTYAAQMAMRNVRCCCNKNEITNGIEVLRHFIKDIAESLIDEDQDILDDVNISAGSLRDPSLLRWKSLVNELRGDRPSIQVPVLKNGLEWEKVKVAKGTFDLTASCLPDPFLLAVKAAINFSSHVGTKLMPACPMDDSDSSVSEDEDEVTCSESV